MFLRYALIGLFFFTSFLINDSLLAQSRQIVYFRDKANNSQALSSPASYLSVRALQRRANQKIAINSLDLPVTKNYTDSLLRLGNVQLIGTSKWLNAALLQSDDPLIWDRIRSISFVQKIEEAAFRSSKKMTHDKWLNESQLQQTHESNLRMQSANGDADYGSGLLQIQLHNGTFLHRLGATGKPLFITFMDAGYSGYLTNPFLDAVRSQNRIIATKDFVSGGENVNANNSHGLNCLSITAGYKPGSFIGSCPDASFFLLRTEDAASEYLIEEFNWAMGAEYADSCGTDIISSSLSYTTFDNPNQNHSYNDMDGNTTPITRAADVAAQKGILVVTSAGNDGGSAWKYIGAPADADSVMTVGAVNLFGTIAGFSSFGPTADKRIKPDAVGMGQGTVLSTASGTLSQASGTSFSTPIIAGLAGCLWQLFPEKNNMELIRVVRQSSDRFTFPGNQYGYGIPDMRKAVGILLSQTAKVNFSINQCKPTITWRSKDVRNMKYLVERKRSGDDKYSLVYEKTIFADTFTTREYSFTDRPLSGKYMYRITQLIDTSVNGPVKVLLDSIEVNFPLNCETNNNNRFIQLFPNPAYEEITVRFNEPAAIDQMNLIIYSSNGERVLTKNLNIPSGVYSFSIPIRHLPSGIYYLECRKGKQLYGVSEFIK